jgi:hypothetical protein
VGEFLFSQLEVAATRTRNNFGPPLTRGGTRELGPYWGPIGTTQMPTTLRIARGTSHKLFGAALTLMVSHLVVTGCGPEFDSCEDSRSCPTKGGSAGASGTGGAHVNGGSGGGANGTGGTSRGGKPNTADAGSAGADFSGGAIGEGEGGASGGSISTGGSLTGGVPGAGGDAGGVSGAAGEEGTEGGTHSGGIPTVTGGASTGGAVGSGGASGGAKATGGVATGGTITAGGTIGTGGGKATGGVATTGGSGSGGASTTGGGVATGGTAGSPCTEGETQWCNLSADDCGSGVSSCVLNTSDSTWHFEACRKRKATEPPPGFTLDRVWCPDASVDVIGSPCTRTRSNNSPGTIGTLQSKCAEFPSTCGYLYCE